MKYAWIYDTPALAGHATGASRRLRVGLRLIADDPDFRVTVPVMCLLEAYPATPPETHHILDSLTTNPGVIIEPVRSDPHSAKTVGHLAAETGRLGAAHAAHIARTGGRPTIVFTDESMPADIATRPV